MCLRVLPPQRRPRGSSGIQRLSLQKGDRYRGDYDLQRNESSSHLYTERANVTCVWELGVGRRDVSRNVSETLTCETGLGQWMADEEEKVKERCVTKLQTHGERHSLLLYRFNSGAHERGEKRLRWYQRLFSQYASIF